MIKSFSGSYRFLSNFWICQVMFDGDMYPSSEAAYQAAKTFNIDIRKKIAAMKPGETKKFARTILIRPDWEDVKVSIMTTIVRDKFTRNSNLRELLLMTGDQELIEGNTWNDTFWGVCRGTGENNLGKILMKVREELKNG